MRFSHKLRVLLAILFISVCQVSHAQPMLNGVGVHQELGREIFIGALFSESLSNDPGTLLTNSQPMRMELKVVAPEGLTARRFSRLWIEGLAVNSKADELLAQADNTVLFDNMFKGRLEKDDHLVITNTPGSGVSVMLNKIAIGSIPDNTFFYMLLSTWIGSVPLSSDYRDSLLQVGDIDANLRNRFTNITPAVGRAAEVNNWGSTPKPVAAEQSQLIAETKIEKPAAIAAVTPKLDIPKLEAPKLAKPSIPAPSTTPAPVAQQSSASQASSAPAVVAAATAAQPAAEDDDDEGPALTAQTLLARQFYVSDSIKKIRTQTRYPQRALSRNQEGSLRVAVVVDRKGNLINSSIIEESAHGLLNKEALEAVKRAAPFPDLPDAITGVRFEFTVPMRWALP